MRLLIFPRFKAFKVTFMQEESALPCLSHCGSGGPWALREILEEEVGTGEGALFQDSKAVFFNNLSLNTPPTHTHFSFSNGLKSSFLGFPGREKRAGSPETWSLALSLCHS